MTRAARLLGISRRPFPQDLRARREAARAGTRIVLLAAAVCASAAAARGAPEGPLDRAARDAETLRVLVPMLSDESPTVRDRAVLACADLVDPAAVEALGRSRTARDPLVRLNVADGLGLTGARAAVAPLRELALGDPQAEVRLAAVEALAGLEFPEAAEACVAASRHADPQVRAAALHALHRLGDPRALTRARDGTLDGDALVRRSARRVLRELAHDEALALLREAAHEPDWRCRVQAAEDALWLEEPEGLPVLVHLLDDPVMRVAETAHGALVQLTGSQMDRDPELWEGWLRQNRDCWSGPSDGAPHADVRSTRASYHGLRIASDRIAFVLDASGSMARDAYGGSRWDAAVRELLRTLDQLPDGTVVAVLLFDEQVMPERPRAVRLDPGRRDSIRRLLEGHSPGGDTNLLAALRQAVALPEVDTVYVLSDGSPTLGDMVDARRVREAVRRANFAPRKQIHSIGFGLRAGPARRLLEHLAGDTGGGSVFR